LCQEEVGDETEVLAKDGKRLKGFAKSRLFKIAHVQPYFTPAEVPATDRHFLPFESFPSHFRHCWRVTRPHEQLGQVLSAFESEAVPHLHDLFRVAVRLLLDQTRASDAVQETYLVAWQTFDRYQRGTNCRAWLFGILFNVIRHEQRRWQKWITGANENFAETQLVAPQPVPDNLTDREILAALDRLPVQFRAVLLLVDVEEFSYREASDILGVPLGTVMSRVSRARKVLRGQLAHVARAYGVPTVDP
jgi:RNA polymerase sigma-70 factor (ECF subfamily)